MSPRLPGEWGRDGDWPQASWAGYLGIVGRTAALHRVYRIREAGGWEASSDPGH